jgi:hypothetical protein
LTEITAEVGEGVGGAGGIFGGLLGVELPPPEDDEPPDFAPVVAELGPPALKGSLLSKSENDLSCPAPADACTESIS